MRNRLIKKDLIEKLLGLSKNRISTTVNDQYIFNLLRETDTNSIDSLVDKLTANFLLKLKESSKDIDQVEGILNKYKIMVLPDCRFDAEIVPYRNEYYIVLHYGLLYSLERRIQFDILSLYVVLESKIIKSNKIGFVEFITLAASAYFHKFMESAVDIPNITDKFPSKYRNIYNTTVYDMQMFVLLHEVGHIELGHIKNNSNSRIMTIHEMKTINEQEYIHEELSADIFAVENLNKMNRKIFSFLFSFFAYLAFYEIEIRKNKKARPVAEIRRENLVKMFSKHFDSYEQETIRNWNEKFELMRNKPNDSMVLNRIGKFISKEELDSQLFEAINLIF